MSSQTIEDQPIIRLDGVSKRFGKTKALEAVSLEISPGVVFALLGENGAGKTTLIRILTGFLQPDRGEAWVLGYGCVGEGQEIRRRIGYVSDAPSLYEWMTPEEIGWFTSAFYRAGFSDRYLRRLAEFDVPSGKKLKHLSKGQRAKVALALATSHEPELLILDEPTSGLDPMVRRQFLESMVDVAAAGRTVLLSSHQISEVERVADWVAILHQGELKLVQRLDDLKQSTSIVTVTLQNPGLAVSLPPGIVLSEIVQGNQIRWLVRDLPEHWDSELSSNPVVLSLDRKHPTLEEIFVAVCDPTAHVPLRNDDENTNLAAKTVAIP